MSEAAPPEYETKVKEILKNYKARVKEKLWEMWKEERDGRSWKLMFDEFIWETLPSKKAFHDELVVEVFGADYMENLRNEQTNYVFTMKGNRQSFQGDWFQLAYLLRCHESSTEQRGTDKGGICNCPFCQKTQKKSIHLEYANLKAANLENAYLGYAHLENAYLGYANLKNAYLGYANLENAYLGYANLKNAKLKSAHLENANLEKAHLEKANLSKAILKDANLNKAHLEKANLSKAILKDANLYKANLAEAKLENADLTNAKLQNAVLDRADVHGATGIVFDNNRVERILIEGNAPDPWSVLRRSYTGPSFFFHLVLLVAFFIPYLSKAVVLTGVHEGMELIDKKGIPASVKIESRTDFQTPAHEFVDKTAEKSPVDGESVERARSIAHYIIDALPSISTFLRKLRDIWQGMGRQSALWTLLGFGNYAFGVFSFFLVTLMMIFYNIIRYILTREVNALRDAEERAKITPRRDEYMAEGKGSWRKRFTTWKKETRNSWRDACKFALLKIWETERWIIHQLMPNQLTNDQRQYEKGYIASAANFYTNIVAIIYSIFVVIIAVAAFTVAFFSLNQQPGTMFCCEWLITILLVLLLLMLKRIPAIQTTKQLTAQQSTTSQWTTQRWTMKEWVFKCFFIVLVTMFVVSIFLIVPLFDDLFSWLLLVSLLLLQALILNLPKTKKWIVNCFKFLFIIAFLAIFATIVVRNFPVFTRLGSLFSWRPSFSCHQLCSWIQASLQQQTLFLILLTLILMMLIWVLIKRLFIPVVIAAIVVIIFSIVPRLDYLLSLLLVGFLPIAVLGCIFGPIVENERSDKKELWFVETLFPPSPIKYFGLYRFHQIATVFMYVGYGALAIQIFKWLWVTQIPTY